MAGIYRISILCYSFIEGLYKHRGTDENDVFPRVDQHLGVYQHIRRAAKFWSTAAYLKVFFNLFADFFLFLQKNTQQATKM